MIVRLSIVAAVSIAVFLFARWWRAREGRFTEGSGRFDRAELGIARASRPSAVLVEFYGEHCAPCITVQNRIAKLSEEIPDVVVAQVDAGARLDLADRYNVRRVPTLFVTDPDLRIIWRASGVPTEEAIREALLGPDWAGRPHPAQEIDARAHRPRRRSKLRARP